MIIGFDIVPILCQHNIKVWKAGKEEFRATL